jgi:hypothetical protein
MHKMSFELQQPDVASGAVARKWPVILLMGAIAIIAWALEPQLADIAKWLFTDG